ncbi:MAG: ATP-binding protein, partial [Thermoprotei archaeon]
MARNSKSGVLDRIREEVERARERLSRIRWKVAVVSVKGGVGKSFVVANLAVALAERGHRVGVLDADVHGPSIPRALGLRGLTLVAGPEGLLPATGPLGVKVISMALLLSDEKQAVVWRGPMKTAFIRQVLAMAAWGSLDYLLIDLPPGTGDEQLTIAQLIEDLSGLLVVTTPAELSYSIAAKAGTFAKLLGVRVIGVIENMSYFRCPVCGSVHRIF